MFSNHLVLNYLKPSALSPLAMAKLIGILFFVTLSGTVFSQEDNAELKKIADEDQSARRVKNIDWSVVSIQDKEREKRVYELIEAGKIVTGKDYYRSALIFHHSTDEAASAMAVKHMKKAIELDPSVNKWLLAAAMDRDLMKQKKPQIYGTQYVRSEDDKKWIRYDLDPTQVTDEQRKEYGVETLAEQLEKERRMNLLSVSDFFAESNSIEKTVALIESEYKKGLNSTYNVTEDKLNRFGYELVDAKKHNEALAIFVLNTELYPTEFNTFDSLGELLLLLGQKEEGIKAYKKSLELNPSNDYARKIIESQP